MADTKLAFGIVFQAGFALMRAAVRLVTRRRARAA